MLGIEIAVYSVIVGSTYVNLKDEIRGGHMLYYFLSRFITFIGYDIVIYSIFYFSFAGSFRNNDQLRTLGTIFQHIIKIVYRI